jgi:hypothetical protein
MSDPIGSLERGAYSVRPVCREAGCNQPPATPGATGEGGDWCPPHLAVIRALRAAAIERANTMPHHFGQRGAAPCGTEAAHHQHVRNGEPIDGACRVAHNQYTTLRRAVRRESAA